MEKHLKRQKKVSWLIGAFVVLGFVSHDLLRETQQDSGVIKSGTTLYSPNMGGRVSCEVPIPSLGFRGFSVEKEPFPEKLQDFEPEAQSAASKSKPKR